MFDKVRLENFLEQILPLKASVVKAKTSLAEDKRFLLLAVNEKDK